MTASSTNAVAIRSALDVDDAAVETRMARIQKQAGGLFPQNMTALQAAQLARLSLAYGLDPFAREIILYQGEPYVTSKGYMRMAIDHAQYDGMEEPRGPTAEERAAFHVAEDDYFFVVRVWRKDRRFPAVGYARARVGERIRDGRGGWITHPVVEQYPAEMALKRAKMRALRDAFALPLPVFDEGRDVPADIDDAPRGPVIEGQVRELAGSDSAFATTNEVEKQERPEPIRPDQISAIHAIGHAIGWITKDDDEPYRAALLATFRVATSKDLTANQAAAFIEVLVAEQEHMITADAPVRSPAESPRLRALIAAMDDGEAPDWPAPATRTQRERLQARAAEIGMTTTQLAGLIQAQYGEGVGLEALDARQCAALLALLRTGELAEAPQEELAL